MLYASKPRRRNTSVKCNQRTLSLLHLHFVLPFCLGSCSAACQKTHHDKSRMQARDLLLVLAALFCLLLVLQLLTLCFGCLRHNRFARVAQWIRRSASNREIVGFTSITRREQFGISMSCLIHSVVLVKNYSHSVFSNANRHQNLCHSIGRAGWEPHHMCTNNQKTCCRCKYTAPNDDVLHCCIL